MDYTVVNDSQPGATPVLGPLPACLCLRQGSSCVIGGFFSPRAIRLLGEICVQVLDNVLELPRVHPELVALVVVVSNESQAGWGPVDVVDTDLRILATVLHDELLHEGISVQLREEREEERDVEESQGDDATRTPLVGVGTYLSVAYLQNCPDILHGTIVLGAVLGAALEAISDQLCVCEETASRQRPEGGREG